MDKKLGIMVSMIIALLFIFGSGIPVAEAQQAPTTSYGAFSSAFAAPALTGVGTATLTYTAGSVYQGGLLKPITAGTVTTFDATQNNCTAPAFSACDFVYWTSGTALVKSNVYNTAYNGGANVIVAYVTTDGSSNILTITPAALQLPAIQANIGTGFSCGTIAAGGACANTSTGGTFHIVVGIATLAGSTSTITGLAPAFTSAATFFCVGNDITTRANPVQAVPASGTTVTFTNTTGATDNIQFICAGY